MSPGVVIGVTVQSMVARIQSMLTDHQLGVEQIIKEEFDKVDVEKMLREAVQHELRTAIEQTARARAEEVVRHVVWHGLRDAVEKASVNEVAKIAERLRAGGE